MTRRDAARAEAIAGLMAGEWALGRAPTAESYLGRHPWLWDRPSVAVRIIYEEICQRQKAGRPIGRDELARRFPLFMDEIRILIEFHDLMVPLLEPPRFPEVGEGLGPYRILRQIARGGAARVFLAEDSGDPSRRFVLKMGPGLEHERDVMSLLSHPFVARLDRSHEFPDRNLHVLCMPDQGGTSLAAILAALAATDASTIGGPEFVHAARPTARGDAGREVVIQSRWPEIIARIGACLAEALDHIHGLGLVHFDVKPSNILITDRFDPVLLDFHLTRGPVALGSVDLDLLGGTPGYMSPEQKLDIAAARRLAPSPRGIDRRSDVFSLGCVLFEALGGGNPARHRGVGTRLYRKYRGPDLALCDIVLRCLAPAPEDRFASASALSSALKAYLSGHPLLNLADPEGSPRDPRKITS